MEVQVIAKDAPAELVRRIDLDAQARNVTRQEAVAGVLCDRLGVRRDPSARGWISPPQGTTIHLKVPAACRARLRRKASTAGGTLRGVILNELAAHYGLPSVTTDRRSRS